MNKSIEIITGKTCYIYDCGSDDVLLIQPVDDHDLEMLDSEVTEIERLAENTGFTLAAFKVDDWNTDLSPWEAPPIFGNKDFGGAVQWYCGCISLCMVPGMDRFCKGKNIKAPYVYLSLGDKEEKAKNPVMQTVGDNIRKQHEILGNDKGCKDCMHSNSGSGYIEA